MTRHGPGAVRRAPARGRWRRGTIGLAALLATALLAAGCSQPAPFAIKDRSPKKDRAEPWDPPNTYPEWAYDAPSSMKPAADLTPVPRARPEDPLHYFTNKRLVPIRQPGGYNSEELPRMAIWWTDNNGFQWNKGGYFGQNQPYFWFDAPADGDYGIRFVGPGQEPATLPVAAPERVYHVDTMLPDVQLVVEPNQALYEPGQTVTLHWTAHDFHLRETPVEIGMSLDASAESPKWTVLQKELLAEGSYSYTVPDEALDHGIVFRVAAEDRAGNVGMNFSHVLQVVQDATAAQPFAGEAMQGAAEEDLTALEGIEEPAAEGAIPEDTPVSQKDSEPATEIEIDLSEIEAGAPQGSSIPEERGVDPTLPDIDESLIEPKSRTAPQRPDLIDFDVLFSNEVEPDESVAQRPADRATRPDGTHAPRRNQTPDAAERADAASERISPPVIQRATVGEDGAESPKRSKSGKGRARRPVSPGADSRAIQRLPLPGLVAPLPGTVDWDEYAIDDDRPWMVLDRTRAKDNPVVWLLPRPAFMDDTFGLFEMQYLSDNPEMIPAGPGASSNRPYAGIVEFSDEPMGAIPNRAK